MTRMSELVFEVTQEEDGGFCAECLSANIFTQGDTWEALRKKGVGGNNHLVMGPWFHSQINRAAEMPPAAPKASGTLSGEPVPIETPLSSNVRIAAITSMAAATASA